MAQADAHIEIKWYGDDSLKAIKDNADEALFEGGEALLEAAKSRVPVRTGRLRDSGYVTTKTQSSYAHKQGYKKERKPEESGVVGIGFSAPHSHLVEFGTKKMNARPYLRPALDELKEKLGEKIVVKWSRLINK